MRCPACGTYQPARLARCFLCGEAIMPPKSNRQGEEAMPTRTSRPGANTTKGYDVRVARPGKSVSRGKLLPQRKMPTLFGVISALFVLLLSAGATVYFLTGSSNNERLLKQGRQELAKGQYAFAVTTLNKAISLRPKDSKAFLALARAYVGVDQIDKAFACVNRAQQLGAGIIAEPELASDLTNYYRLRGRYDKAIDLLRPLAQANIPGKKAELADLDALCGDVALRNGQIDLALRSWEEVRELGEGSRFTEADARLSTIYQKLADAAASNKDDAKALAYLDKLNLIAQNARNYILASAIYERQGKLELAIEQTRKALNLDPHSPVLSRQLSNLLTRRGKELMDAGNNEAGYAYLQQARSFDATSPLPEVTLRNLNVGLEGATRCPRVNGEVWNPTDKTILSVILRAELWDKVNEKLLWSKDSKLVDEFVPPLAAKQSRPFDFVATAPVKANGQSEFKIYLNGTFYKAYPIDKVEQTKTIEETATASSGREETTRAATLKEQPINPAPLPKPAEVTAKGETSFAPLPGHGPLKVPNPISREPSEAHTERIEPSPSAPSAEEKTMKDLDF